MIPFWPHPSASAYSPDPRLEPINPTDKIDELVNEQLERGRTDLR